MRFRQPPRSISQKRPLPRWRLWWRGISLARLLLIAILLVVITYFFLPRMNSMTVNGLVNGHLQPVATLSQIRVIRPIARCTATVRSGQRLAVVSNDLLAGRDETAVAKAVQELANARAAQQYGHQAAMAVVHAARQNYAAAATAADRDASIYEGYKHLYAAGAIGRQALDDAALASQQNHEEALADLARLEQAKAILIQADANADAAVIGAEATYKAQRTLLAESRNNLIHAPVTGELLGCQDNAGQVIPAGGTLYHIFDRDRAYVTAFVPSEQINELDLSGPVRMSIAGVPGTIHGRIVSVLPEAKSLPPALLRYFWQKPQWTQYRPVRVNFVDLTNKQRSALLYGIRATLQLPTRSWIARLAEE